MDAPFAWADRAANKMLISPFKGWCPREGLTLLSAADRPAVKQGLWLDGLGERMEWADPLSAAGYLSTDTGSLSSWLFCDGYFGRYSLVI